MKCLIIDRYIKLLSMKTAIFLNIYRVWNIDLVLQYFAECLNLIADVSCDLKLDGSMAALDPVAEFEVYSGMDCSQQEH